MNNSRIKKTYILQCLSEFTGINRNAGKNEPVNILEAALFIEDMFGIMLTDNEISAENLGNNKSLEDFVLKKHGL